MMKLKINVEHQQEVNIRLDILERFAFTTLTTDTAGLDKLSNIAESLCEKISAKYTCIAKYMIENNHLIIQVKETEHAIR